MTILCSTAIAHDWQKIDDGFFYTQIGQVHAFKIDPEKFRLSVATAKDLRQQATTAKALAKKTKAALVINGGFFSPENKSLGLLIRNGETLNPLHPTGWWGVFYILDREGKIIPPHAFKMKPNMEMALQAGPRLVVNKQMPLLKPSQERPRSGIGVRKDGTLIIAAVANTGFTMDAFAKLFQKKEKKGGLEVLNALNLDGGKSTQIYVDWKGFKLDMPGIVPITNAIVLFPRSNQ